MKDFTQELEKMKHDIILFQKERDLSKQKSIKKKSHAEIITEFQLEEKINTLQQAIHTHEEHNPYVSYYLLTGDLLCQYYDNIDVISKGDDSKRKRSVGTYKSAGGTKGAPPHAPLPRSRQTVIDFFTTNTQKPSHEELSPDVYSSQETLPSVSTGNDATYLSRHVLLDQYLQRTDPMYVPLSSSKQFESDTITDGMEYRCPDCDQERMLFSNDATFVCQNASCGRMDNVLIDANKPSYKDMPHDNGSYYSYKRINHFNEWLAQFQAKETTDIPDEVYNRILLELKKERVQNVLQITYSKMKEILKRLKLNKYYEHIPHITNHINGQPAPVMTRATEEKLRSMFKEVQAPFIKHCPRDRKNFLSYSYVLHKFCELLSLDDFLHCFQLLKSREKLHHQDQIWEKICKELRWEFIKSI
jgi:hypothetical protein